MTERESEWVDVIPLLDRLRECKLVFRASRYYVNTHPSRHAVQLLITPVDDGAKMLKVALGIDGFNQMVYMRYLQGARAYELVIDAELLRDNLETVIEWLDALDATWLMRNR